MQDGDHNISSNCPEGQDARIIADLARNMIGKGILPVHIALDDARASELSELLAFFAPDIDVLYFPSWDCLPYDRVSPHAEITSERISVLIRLNQIKNNPTRKDRPKILITTANATLQKVVPQDSLASSGIHIKTDKVLERTKIEKFLSENGYIRTQIVREAGEFAFRGDIIDIFPSGFKEPIRIDLFDNEVEKIRYFDPEQQISTDIIDDITLHPAGEFCLNDESVAKFRSGYRNCFGVTTGNDPLYEAVSEKRIFSGTEHWLPLFYDKMETILDYIDNPHITIDRHVKPSIIQRIAQINDFYQARLTIADSEREKSSKNKKNINTGAIYHPLPSDMLYLDENEWSELFKNAKTLDGNGTKPSRDFTDIRLSTGGDNLYREVGSYILHKLTEKKKVLLSAYTEGSLSRTKAILENHCPVKLIECKSFEDFKKLKTDQAGTVVLPLERGFDADDLCIITEQDIFGDRISRRASSKRKKADNFLREVSSLNEGDIVAHIEHGIGRFIGLETLSVGKTLHDCLKLEYERGDKLFVPVENIEVLSRYGGDSEIVKLDKLGGVSWQARKAKVKRNLLEIAGKLIEIAASRKMQRCENLELDKHIYDEFSAKFAYQETEDQERAIEHILQDLESGTPMDRLVCGDVGFGKTEVAMRAAFVAAMNGYQVAVAVPTTLLARQHFQSFTRRFSNTGLRVVQLSRMIATKETESVKKEIREGSANIVIGTHALFSKGVKFNNLGLLIIDEEQRFGVKQKEKLKEMSEGVHVLTLTATPIPRTLQMAMSGVRDMSIIATPPVDRLAIRTFVTPFDPIVIREALLRERYRGGQSFYVCPRIKDLQSVEETLKDLVPELKIVIAHGQMTPSELEDRMTAFYDGQYDVLVATNIIESGIDVPTANTMIIHRSDMFGLAQLYQIRGRIGRSKLRAYAYLTYEPTKMLSKNAIKRLEAIETLDTLGAGFQLASHDMDIRGAGNLLGEAQSGHVREVGVELYQQMLEEAVANIKSNSEDFNDFTDSKWSPTINIGMSVLIPEKYVPDLNVRMSLYRRLGDIKDSEETQAFAAEMIDRFGKIPEEFENLLKIVEIKQICLKSGIENVEAGNKGALISFRNNKPPNPDKLLDWMMSRGGTLKLRPDHKISVIRNWDKLNDRIKGVKSLINEIAGVVG